MTFHGQLYTPTRYGKTLMPLVISLQIPRSASQPVWSAAARTAFRTLASVEALLTTSGR